MEYASQDWSTCAILDRIHRRKAIRGFSGMSDTVRGNLYLLTAEDSFCRYCHVYPIPNKEAHTRAKVLMDQHSNIYGLPD